MPSPTCEVCRKKIRFLRDLFWFDDGTRVCGPCYNCEGPKMDFQPGDIVEVLDIGANRLYDPSRCRYVKNGDTLVVRSVDLGSIDLVRFMGIGDLGALWAGRLRKIEEPVIQKECTCPDLINGHHSGCPYQRKD